jgi:hypothetical protein
LVRVGLDIGASGLAEFSLDLPPRTAYASEGSLHPVSVDSVVLAINAACPDADPVGGIAELPQVGGSGTADRTTLVAGVAAGLLALTVGAWYARRRWVS